MRPLVTRFFSARNASSPPKAATCFLKSSSPEGSAAPVAGGVDGWAGLDSWRAQPGRANAVIAVAIRRTVVGRHLFTAWLRDFSGILQPLDAHGSRRVRE